MNRKFYTCTYIFVQKQREITCRYSAKYLNFHSFFNNINNGICTLCTILFSSYYHFNASISSRLCVVVLTFGVYCLMCAFELSDVHTAYNKCILMLIILYDDCFQVGLVFKHCHCGCCICKRRYLKFNFSNGDDDRHAESKSGISPVFSVSIMTKSTKQHNLSRVQIYIMSLVVSLKLRQARLKKLTEKLHPALVDLSLSSFSGFTMVLITKLLVFFWLAFKRPANIQFHTTKKS